MQSLQYKGYDCSWLLVRPRIGQETPVPFLTPSICVREGAGHSLSYNAHRAYIRGDKWISYGCDKQPGVPSSCLQSQTLSIGTGSAYPCPVRRGSLYKDLSSFELFLQTDTAPGTQSSQKQANERERRNRAKKNSWRGKRGKKLRQCTHSPRLSAWKANRERKQTLTPWSSVAPGLTDVGSLA